MSQDEVRQQLREAVKKWLLYDRASAQSHLLQEFGEKLAGAGLDPKAEIQHALDADAERDKKAWKITSKSTGSDSEDDPEAG